VTKSNAPRTPPINTILDSWGFLVAAAIGAGSILLFKWLGFEQQYVTSAPVIVMICYASVLWFSRRFRIREDQTGDNLYYLGFLFTLTSLSYTLWNAQHGIDSEKIIGDFGIALATTIVGLTLRIFFNQMRVDQSEVEGEARLSLIDASLKLRSELDAVVIDMNHFRRATQQSVTETISEATKTAMSAMSLASENFRTSVGSIIKELNTTIGRVGEQVELLSSATNRVAESVSSAAIRIEKVEVPKDVVANALNAVVGQVSDAAESLKSRMAVEEKALKKLVKAAETASESTDLWSGQIERQMELIAAAQGKMLESTSMFEKVQDLTNSFARGVERLNSATDALKDEAVRLTLKNLADEFAKSVDEIAEHNKQLFQHVRDARENSNLVASTLVELSNGIVKKLQDVGTPDENSNPPVSTERSHEHV
jgi:hypothetical protein